MDYFTVNRKGDNKLITIAVDSIVSFYDDAERSTRISLKNGEYIETSEAIASILRKQLQLMTHRVIKVGDK